MSSQLLRLVQNEEGMGGGGGQGRDTEGRKETEGGGGGWGGGEEEIGREGGGGWGIGYCMCSVFITVLAPYAVVCEGSQYNGKK